MTLTKKMDWEALMDEARRQWAAGNAAGVRWFYNRLRDNMPVDVRNDFADLLASEPVSRASHRPRKQAEVTTREAGPMHVEFHYPLAMQFVIPESATIAEHVAKLQAIGNESAVTALVAMLKRAYAKGDTETLRRYKLQNATAKAFNDRALEAARKAVFLKSQTE